MSDSTKTPVLVLRSTSRNFPFDLLPEIERSGHPVTSLDDLEGFIASKVRDAPFLAVMEVGSLADLERAHLAYEWVEQTQPLAPARFLLLLASKNLQVGDRLRRFGATTEVATLPQPARNLLFKLELQQRLLASRPAGEKLRGKGFSAQLEQDSSGRRRVLVARGPDDKAGDWKQGDNSPQGKVRWRWINQPDPHAPDAVDPFTWLTEGGEKPVFDKAREAWLVEGEAPNLRCFRGDQPIYSAVEDFASEETPKALASGANTPEKSAGEIATGAARKAPAPAAAESREQKSSPVALARPEKEKTEREMPGAAPRPEREKTDKPIPQTREEPEKIKREPVAANRESPDRRTSALPEPGEVDGPIEAAAAAPENEASQEPRREPARGAAYVAPGEAPVRVKGGIKEGSLREKIAAVLEKHEAIPSVRSGDDDEDFSRPESMPSMHNESVAHEAPVPGTVSLHLPQQEKNRPAETEVRRLDPLERPETVKYGTGHPRIPPSDEKSSAPGKAKPAENLAIPSPVAPKAESPGAAVPQPSVEISPAPTPRAHDYSFDSGLPPLSSRPTSDQTMGATANRLASETRIASEVPASPPTQMETEPPSEKRTPRDLSPAELSAMVKAKDAPLSGKERAAAPELSKGSATFGRTEEDPSRRFLQNRLFMLMTLAELGDKQSSWHPVGTYRIYLSAQHRYYGLPHPAEVLPLWIYEGELAPEFIDEKKCWKFYDRLPASVYSLDSLPLEVLDYIYKMAGLPLPEKFRLESVPTGGSNDVPLSQETNKTSKSQVHDQPETTKETSAWDKLVSFIRGIFGG